jgi:hypothetical protein
LFGGKGEEVGYQNFKPGESELVASEKEKLDDIAKGMYERPGLEVEIEGSYDPVADRDGLRRVKLDQQLRLHKWSNLRKSEQAATSPQEIVLTPEERTRLIAGLYQGSTNVPVAESGSKPAPKPTKVTAVAGASEKGAQVLMGPQLTAEERANVASETERSLLQTISISENDLRDLARARAVQVQNYLVQTAKVEAERVYLTQDRQGSAGTNGHKVFLHLQ